MRRATHIADEICIAYSTSIIEENRQLLIEKISGVFIEVAVKDIQELCEMRNVETDSGLLSILKQQRQKYIAICNRVNTTLQIQFLSIADFDNAIESYYPLIYEWYISNIEA